MFDLWIRDFATKKVRKLGTNSHDSLVSTDGGKTLKYYNLQNGCGSLDDYRFCHEDGTPLEFDNYGDESIYIGESPEYVEKKSANWMFSGDYFYRTATCGCCGYVVRAIAASVTLEDFQANMEQYRFCPNCGASMDAEEED